MIDGNAFEQLEQRIGKAIDRIQELTRERDALRDRKVELEAQMEQLQGSNLELQMEIEQVRESSVDKAEFEERKREIERRVESLLERFGELDDPAAD